MGFITLFFLAIGLAMDAFAVSVSNGICHKNAGIKEALLTATTFGLFQAGMPLIGYYTGRTISSAVEFLDHWIALVLLTFIGGSMIYEAIKELRRPGKSQCKARFSMKDILVQGVATSVDAFAVGISFAMIPTDIVSAVGLIGIVTFLFSVLGVYLGRSFGGLLKEKAEFIGGCILILIGLKIFIEHTMNGI
jgi:putative Mn2+ efflux pump MntP